MVAVVIRKLSEQISNSARIVLLNSPGGSTMQWGMGQGLLCSTPLISQLCDSTMINVYISYD